jgi:hypothetical protein
MIFDERFFEKFDFTEEQILLHFQNALRDFKIARDVGIPEVKFAYAYQALLKAGLAILARHGHRVRSIPGHQTKILSQLSTLLGDPEVMDLGEVMRSKRNKDFYGGGVVISEKECGEYLTFVERAIRKVEKALGLAEFRRVESRPPAAHKAVEAAGGFEISLPKRRPFRHVFQLKIVLLETDPPVWRRIQIPESYTFYDLHVAIQNAMGWTDSHLHAYEIRLGPRDEETVRIENPYALDELEDANPLVTTEVPLTDYLNKKGDRIFYEYDFGDGWEHEIVVEDILPKKEDSKYPVCLNGAMTCPPEDCGGISGYEDCKRAIRRKDDSDGFLTWLGGWKPDEFDSRRVRFENPRKRLLDSLKD